jgi:Fe2+ transport system protein FeoA
MGYNAPYRMVTVLEPPAPTMTTTFLDPTGVIHLPTQAAPAAMPATRSHVRKGLRLTDLRAGEIARVLRVNISDTACRKRFAELGLAEGMKVTVASTGDTLMLIIGGARMGLAARCADDIVVSRVAA